MFRRFFQSMSKKLFKTAVKGSSRRKPVTRKLEVENLESRQLMAAGLSASLSQGILTIDATPQADKIVVRQNQNRISIAGVPQSFDARQVKRIMVEDFDSNDTIKLMPGGAGRQTIKAPTLRHWENGLLQRRTATGGWKNVAAPIPPVSPPASLPAPTPSPVTVPGPAPTIQLPDGSSNSNVSWSNGVLTINGTNTNDVVQVGDIGTTVIVRMNSVEIGRIDTLFTKIDRLVFNGNGGYDFFRNDTSISADFNGTGVYVNRAQGLLRIEGTPGRDVVQVGDIVPHVLVRFEGETVAQVDAREVNLRRIEYNGHGGIDYFRNDMPIAAEFFGVGVYVNRALGLLRIEGTPGRDVVQVGDIVPHVLVRFEGETVTQVDTREVSLRKIEYNGRGGIDYFRNDLPIIADFQATGVYVDQSQGLLRVNGTTGRDIIQIGDIGTNVLVRFNGDTVAQFSTTEVTLQQIKINGFGGNDELRIDLPYRYWLEGDQLYRALERSSGQREFITGNALAFVGAKDGSVYVLFKDGTVNRLVPFGNGEAYMEYVDGNVQTMTLNADGLTISVTYRPIPPPAPQPGPTVYRYGFSLVAYDSYGYQIRQMPFETLAHFDQEAMNFVDNKLLSWGQQLEDSGVPYDRLSAVLIYKYQAN